MPRATEKREGKGEEGEKGRGGANASLRRPSDFLSLHPNVLAVYTEGDSREVFLRHGARDCAPGRGGGEGGEKRGKPAS